MILFGYTIENMEWNNSIAAGETIEFGFLADTTTTPQLTNIAINGIPVCTSSNDDESEDDSSDNQNSDDESSNNEGSDENNDDENDEDNNDSNDQTCLANIQIDITNQWNSGFEASVTLQNSGSSTINGWELSFDYEPQIQNIWNVDITKSGSNYTLTPKGWNSVINPSEAITFGFIGNWNESNVPSISNAKINGMPVCY